MMLGGTEILEVATMIHADYHAIGREWQCLALLIAKFILQCRAKVRTILQGAVGVIHIRETQLAHHVETDIKLRAIIPRIGYNIPHTERQATAIRCSHLHITEGRSC